MNSAASGSKIMSKNKFFKNGPFESDKMPKMGFLGHEFESKDQKIESQERDRIMRLKLFCSWDQKFSKKVQKIKTRIFHVIRIWSHKLFWNGNFVSGDQKSKKDFKIV